MSRFSALRSLLLRSRQHHRSPLHHHHHQQQVSPISLSSLVSPLRNAFSSPSQLTSTMSISTLAIPTAASLSSSDSLAFRSYSSDAELPSNMVMVKSEDQLNDSLKKVEDGASAAVFYFTAAWCGPCRFIWPEIKKLSENLHDVKFYKIDIDEVGGGPTLSKLNISAVPTLHFFKNGKKAEEVVGADAKRIKDISSSLYKEG